MKILLLLAAVVVLSNAWCIPFTSWCFGKTDKPTINGRTSVDSNGNIKYRSEYVDDSNIQNSHGKNIVQSISRKKRSSEPKVADVLNRMKRDETYIYEQQKTETERLKHIERVKQHAKGNNIKQSISRKKRSPDDSIYTHIQKKEHNHHIKIIKDTDQIAIGDRIEQSISRKKRSPELKVVADNTEVSIEDNNKNEVASSRFKRYSRSGYCRVTSKTVNGRTTVNTVQIIKGNQIVNQIQLSPEHRRALGDVYQLSMGDNNRITINFKGQRPTCQITLNK